MPYRYRLYGRWKNESFTQHPMLMRRRAWLLKKAKFIMMRITKETIKPVSRGIGKLTHNNPGPIFHYVSDNSYEPLCLSPSLFLSFSLPFPPLLLSSYLLYSFILSFFSLPHILDIDFRMESYKCVFKQRD